MTTAAPAAVPTLPDADDINALLNDSPPDPQDPDTWRAPPLEDVQQHAAYAPEGPLVILGGAGTGKSHTLLARAVGLARAGASPDTISIITFNARASQRIRTQLSDIIGASPDEVGFFIGTLHSYCSSTLRQAAWKYCGIQPGFSIWDQDQSLANLEQITTEDDPDRPPPLMPSELARLLDWINRNACLPEQEQLPAPDATWLRWAESYQYQKRIQNSLDFTDLLVMTRDVFTQNIPLRQAYNSIRSRHLIVDEFQDLTHIQYELIRLMTGPTKSITIALDPNQSIYRWRGATPDIYERFMYDYPNAQVTGLSINHRTSASVMRSWRRLCQNELMTGLVDDFQRSLRRPRSKPQDICVPGTPHAQYTQIATHIRQLLDEQDHQPTDIAVLSRRKRSLPLLATHLDIKEVPYRILGEPDGNQDPDAQSVTAMLTLATNPRNAWALRKAADCNVMKKNRNFNHKITRDIQAHAQQNDLDLIAAAEHIRGEMTRDSALHEELTYTINTYRELQELLDDPATATAAILQLIHDRLYQAGTGRKQRQLSNQMMRLITLADRHDRASDIRHDPRRRVIAYLENLAQATNPDEMSEDNQDPFSHSQTVTLATIHGSKGLQWPTVFLADAADEIIPGSNVKDRTERMEEEQRLFFVAITRAENQYYVYWSQQQDDGAEATPCRFIEPLLH